MPGSTAHQTLATASDDVRATADPAVSRRDTRSTTEVPTFFGPADSPLFGVLHLPADKQIRGGVLICGSLGKDGMDSVRLHRILGDGLAHRGFAVLHFDYLGSGNSSYAQARDDAVAHWVASVGHALDYLTLIGAESTTAVGIRAGCLLLDEYLAGQSHPPNRVVYLDPAGTGRRFLREHATLFRLSVGEDAATPGEVSIVGGRLTDHAAARFAALQIRADPVSGHGVENVLLVGRPDETDRRLTALASAPGVDSVITVGLRECAGPSPRDYMLPIPFTAVDSIAEWIDTNSPTRTHRAAPRYRTTATVPADGPDGVDVVERIERIEPNGLFAIRTLPRHPDPSPTGTVLFFVTGHDLHVGPAREWVELSRRVAATGAQALRWDPAGQGLSGEITRGPWRNIYSKADVSDAIAVARHARQGAGELKLVGICSGSWYAAHAARSIGAQSAILVNLVMWNWRVTPALFMQWIGREKARHANAAVDTATGPSEAKTKRLRGLLNPAREPAKRLMHQHLPRHVLRFLSWIGLVWLPEPVLTTLARRGTDVTLIASPEDAEAFAAKGGRAALERLHRTSRRTRLIAAPTGDHVAHHPAILTAIRGAVLPAEAACPTC
ncbi:hypothetical protein A5712_00605 [Mycobacterium sp. E2327]|uniref:hypothetical protein n=1 Tax=Mycobacterium sp. E2327 TaxID=1834132 RepID=UPI0007FEFF34|nr:hypothetical protein [Mycobacterium sp. E2327]OBI13640.1 hypothetical protein A5712_00605 [Mycobacterium sp. E2327]